MFIHRYIHSYVFLTCGREDFSVFFLNIGHDSMIWTKFGVLLVREKHLIGSEWLDPLLWWTHSWRPCRWSPALFKATRDSDTAGTLTPPAGQQLDHIWNFLLSFGKCSVTNPSFAQKPTSCSDCRTVRLSSLQWHFDPTKTVRKIKTLISWEMLKRAQQR